MARVICLAEEWDDDTVVTIIEKPGEESLDLIVSVHAERLAQHLGRGIEEVAEVVDAFYIDPEAWKTLKKINWPSDNDFFDPTEAKLVITRCQLAVYRAFKIKKEVVESTIAMTNDIKGQFALDVTSELPDAIPEAASLGIAPVLDALVTCVSRAYWHGDKVRCIDDFESDADECNVNCIHWDFCFAQNKLKIAMEALKNES